ncbi:MAG: choline dehydrogenase [Gammaproteobacteria bacterium]|nr:choline dehydrogenase [Gammaproteobacteria bacterium]
MKHNTFDYIVVGAGSAGCVLANRLSAHPDLRVLLLEAGGVDSSPWIHMPAGLARLVHDPRIDWRYYTEPEPELQNRRLYWPRGKVLGGSSSMNAMCYTRGHPLDYEEWAALAGEEWGYHRVLPYFLEAEDQERGAGAYHGVGGPLAVEDLRFRNPLSSVFIAAAAACGLPRNDDFNGDRQEGVGFYQVTQRRGRRCSAAAGYLAPARGRANLEVRTHGFVTRVLFSGTRAIGVECRQPGGTARIHAEGEVLLAAGAIGSPQLLLLSGVGPAEELGQLGVPVVAHSPEVGRNLQDHLDFCTVSRCTQPISYDFNRLQEAGVALRYFLTHSGPGVSNIAEAGGFVRSRLAPDTRPDLQLHFVPAQLDDHGRNRLPGHGFTVHACVLRPRSRGAITLRSARPEDPPRIRAGYLSAEGDLEALLEGVELARDIIRAAPFAPFRGAEVFPGDDVTTRSALEEVVRRKAETIYHPSGSCRMGRDAGAVLDPSLRVRGTEGLRVIDASAMPKLIGGNTNAPTIMIAEKAAAQLLESRCPRQRPPGE